MRPCISQGVTHPWIQQAGTCPTCRVRISIASLRKIFVSVTSSAPSSAAHPKKQTSTARSVNSRVNHKMNSMKKPTLRNFGNDAPRNNNQLSLTSAVNFGRTIYLNSLDRGLTEQSIRALITRLFFIASDRFSVRSLNKINGPQSFKSYVSFKISVDSERTFNTLLRATTWPRTLRVREFIERNSLNA